MAGFSPSVPGFDDAIRKLLKTAYDDAAEPIIKQAVQDFERELRQRAGRLALSLIDRSFSVQRDAHHLVIRVEVPRG